MPKIQARIFRRALTAHMQRRADDVRRRHWPQQMPRAGQRPPEGPSNRRAPTSRRGSRDGDGAPQAKCLRLIKTMVRDDKVSEQLIAQAIVATGKHYRPELANMALLAADKDWRGVHNECGDLKDDDAVRLHKRLEQLRRDVRDVSAASKEGKRMRHHSRSRIRM